MADLSHWQGYRSEDPGCRLAEAGMIVRLSKKLFSAEIMGLIFVILALQVFAYGISASLRGTDTQYLFPVCLLAALIGYGLEKRGSNRIAASIGIAMLGLAGIWILGARLSLPLLTLLDSIAALAPQIIPALREQIPMDTGPVAEAWTVVVQASQALSMRWQSWLYGVNRNVIVNDPLIRNMVWTLVMWYSAAWTGWFASKRNATLALLPILSLLAVVLAYSEHHIETVWLVVILMLLLMGLWNYKNHTNQWERRRVDYSDSILYDNAQAVVFLALSIGAIAFIMPSLSWRDLRDFLRERNSSEAAEMLGIRQQTVPVQGIPAQKPSLPREHMLTQGYAQSQELVMIVRTGELPPVSNLYVPVDVVQHYWRSTIYDQYMGAGWVTSGTTPQKYNANTPLISGLLDGYRLLHMNVQLYQTEGKLFWSGLLYSTDVPFRADWRVRPGSNLFADQTALLQADLFAAAAGATDYRAEAYIPIVSVEDLRAASSEYPEDIRDRYLKLPGNLPERVHQLAKEITHDKDNPFDKANAIEGYLRSNYPYDLDVPAPPEDQDVADYFLFELKRGYCDYYATAMVVLARASGLPARFVSGYSPGTYDALNAQYVVRELNAHSWAEIYFPDIGWIEFEPTASQPAIERIETLAELPVMDAPVSTAERILFQLTSTRFIYWISPLILALALIVLYFVVLERAWILRLAPAHAIAYLYRRYYLLGRPLAGPRTRAETASEFTSKLIQNMEAIQNHSPFTKPLTGFRKEAQQLTNVYLLSLFSNRAISKRDAKEGFNVWKRLRMQILLARLKDYIARGRKKLSLRTETS